MMEAFGRQPLFETPAFFLKGLIRVIRGSA